MGPVDTGSRLAVGVLCWRGHESPGSCLTHLQLRNHVTATITPLSTRRTSTPGSVRSRVSLTCLLLERIVAERHQEDVDVRTRIPAETTEDLTLDPGVGEAQLSIAQRSL